jgi:hypothetical protein
MKNWSLRTLLIAVALFAAAMGVIAHSIAKDRDNVTHRTVSLWGIPNAEAVGQFEAAVKRQSGAELVRNPVVPAEVWQHVGRAGAEAEIPLAYVTSLEDGSPCTVYFVLVPSETTADTIARLIVTYRSSRWEQWRGTIQQRHKYAREEMRSILDLMNNLGQQTDT